MGQKSEDRGESRYCVKDSRRARKREEESRSHHVSQQKTGPAVIIRSQLGGTRTSFEAEDAFDVSCDDVAYSLNKAKRWQKLANAEQIAREQNAPGKTSVVHASLHSHADRRSAGQTASDLANAALSGKKGGVRKYVEAEDGEVSVRSAKSDKTSISSLQSNTGPGPQLKANRHRDRRAKEETEEADGSMSDPELRHVRYCAIELKKSSAKTVERSWRSNQTQHSGKQGWTRKPALRSELDWDSDQDALEEELEEMYEEQLDSELPLRLPDHGKKVVEMKPPKPLAEESQEEVLPPPEETESERKMREKEERKKLKIEKEKRREEEEHRASFVEFRPSFEHSQHLEHTFAKAKEYFDKVEGAACLPVFPRTVVVHKRDSEEILGSKMSSCTFISASTTPEQVELRAALRSCCSAKLAAPVNGWQSHSRHELGNVVKGDAALPSDAPLECPYCEIGGETEELGDTVLVKKPRLFSFSCGHLACHSCWLTHVKQDARNKNTSITCVNPQCRHAITAGEAAALFSDGTLDLFRSFWWDAECGRAGSVICYQCARLLIPLKSGSFAATAHCPCGASTCSRCPRRDHRPAKCADYKTWTGESGYYDSADVYLDRYFYRKMRPSERQFERNCRKCGAEEAVRWKTWCNKCATITRVWQPAPPFSKPELVSILEARGRWIDSETQRHYRMRRSKRYWQCRYATIGRDSLTLFNDNISRELEKMVDEAVFLFELIKVSRLRGSEDFLAAKTDKMVQERIELENSLDAILFDAMETGGDQEEKTVNLRKTMDAIRNTYSHCS